MRAVFAKPQGKQLLVLLLQVSVRLRVGFKAVELPLAEAVERHQARSCRRCRRRRESGRHAPGAHRIFSHSFSYAARSTGFAATPPPRQNVGGARLLAAAVSAFATCTSTTAASKLAADVGHVELGRPARVLAVNVGDDGGLQARKAEAHSRRECIMARGKCDGARVALGARCAEMTGPPGYPRPSALATLSNASPTASSMVAPSDLVVAPARM